jgi:hypothetical protein
MNSLRALPKLRSSARVFAACSCFLVLLAGVLKTGTINYRELPVGLHRLGSPPATSQVAVGAVAHRPPALAASRDALWVGTTTPALPPKLLGTTSHEKTPIRSAYANLPFSFEPNQGQAGKDVKFLARGNGYALFLNGQGALLALRSPSRQTQGERDRLASSGSSAQAAIPSPAARSSLKASAPGASQSSAHSSGNSASGSFEIVRMRLLGANSTAVLTAVDELPGRTNYLIGNQPAKWRTNILNYRKVAERGVYPGIDLVYYGNQRKLEYDFVIAPGADPQAISFDLEGAARLRTDSSGNLVVKMPGGELLFHKPVAYQEISGSKRLVAAGYRLNDGNRVSFELAGYDRSRELVIDPILAYSTYLGGTNIDAANGIAVAPDGSAFITGGTFSSDLLTAHPLQPNAGGPNDFPQDAFVAKISADGSTLLYSTYLGGESQDFANGISVDTFGNAYVVGTTFSPHFPVTPDSVNTLCGGDGLCGASFNIQGFIVSNAFISKLNPAGSALVYSSFLGYYENVVGLAIATDGDGNAYVTGQTGPNFAVTTPVPPPPPFPLVANFQAAVATPTLPGGYGPGVAGATDAFVTKISASGSNILYSTYLGGASEDMGYGIAGVSGGRVYVTGLTYSADFPTVSPLQAAYGGAGDAFFSEIDTTLTGVASLIYSSYLGGSGLDQGNAVVVDSSANAYIAGVTTSISSTLGFTPPAAYQAECALNSQTICEGDAFVAKLDPSASGAASLLYFTYLGGTLAESGTGIGVDVSGNAYVTGSTVSTDFPIAGAVFQTGYGGGNADAFVTELNTTGTALVYSTYLGGTNTDSAYGIAVDKNTPASAFVAGQTCSPDFPLSNPVQTSNLGNCDAFVSKVSFLEGIIANPGGLVFPTQSVGTTSQPKTVTLTNGDTARTITSVAVTGADAADFTETNTCGTSLAAGAQCTVSVSFKPIKPGAISRASVTITDSAPNSPQVISLTGSTSTVGLSTSSLAFGTQPVGVASATQTVTVTNNGTAQLVISGVTASGDFAQTNNCLAALQPATNCVISVTYTPKTAGASMAGLTITDNAAGSPQVVLLTGTGVLQPIASISKVSLTFTNQPVGIASAAQQVVLTNTGSAPLTITSIVATRDFTQSNTCGTSLAVQASCTINVTFTPSSSGSKTGSVTITDNAPGSPQAISLGGNGSDFTLSISPPAANIFAGDGASYTLTVTPNFGFNSTVTLSCGGVPLLSTCSISPGSVTPDGVNPVRALVTITTGARTMVPPGSGPDSRWPRSPGGVKLPWLLWMVALSTLAGIAALRRRRAYIGLGGITLCLAMWAACTNGARFQGPVGTPAGSYTVTIGATSGTVTHSAQVGLTVR